MRDLINIVINKPSNIIITENTICHLQTVDDQFEVLSNITLCRGLDQTTTTCQL